MAQELRSDETHFRTLVRSALPWLVFAVSCGQVQSAATEKPVTIRMSTGFPTGNFRPFSEALVKGYARLMPDVRIEPVDTRGSVRNVEALEDGAVDIGLAQAGIAYMAYNGRLRRVGAGTSGYSRHRHTEFLRGHLLVSPGSSIHSMDELRGRRVGDRPRRQRRRSHLRGSTAGLFLAG